ncbi:hypothetical protein [Mammaliicoccus sciuri]|uniref:hypothetical protein n=1 Tax=Mammaliicoccus sciuri TaxID=1296 RepID=UPI0021CE7CF2|nr:hypothetical protein [Mammaliicoccus sciuri]UXV31717.1 hypothetical protein MUA60_12335 [Mammaliicoccus sciuri]WQK62775.1 hypothetical protein P3U20_11275 [Mammaliicoccus sciuri]
MTVAWNIIKYPALTLAIVVEFFIISSFSTTPIEHSFLFWLVTVAGFEMADQIYKGVEE